MNRCCAWRLAVRAMATVAFSLAMAVTVQGGLIQDGVGLDEPSDRYTDIFCGEHYLGQLTIVDYFAWTSSSLPTPITFDPINPGLNPNNPAMADRAGAKMTAEFSPANPLCPDCEYRWVQGVMSGFGTIGPPPYLDPFNRDDGLPWYWTEPENADPDDGNGGLRFLDIPSQPMSNSGNSIHFEAAFVAVKMSTMEICWLAGFTWGYTIGDNSVSLDQFAWQNAPSGDLVDLVNYWDGGTDPDNGYAGDGDPDGWVVVQDCPCCDCIPEMGSVTMLLVGTTLAGGFVGLRRRAA